MGKNAPERVAAVLLTQPHAANTWHTVAGLPGHYHTEIAAPCATLSNPPREVVENFIAAHADAVEKAAAEWESFRAKRIEDGFGDIGEFVRTDCPVKVVEVAKSEADKGADALADCVSDARHALRSARRAGEAGLPHVENQGAALSGQEK